MRRFYVYVHRKADINEPFYVGKGYSKRAGLIARRSLWWTNTYKKHGRTVEYVMKDLTEEEAFELECFVIQTCKDRGFTLVNLTAGGDGSSGYKASEETKQKKRLLMKGNSLAKGYKHTEETKAVLREKAKGNSHNKGIKYSPERRASCSVASKRTYAAGTSPLFKYNTLTRNNI